MTFNAITIADAIDNIDTGKYFLPGIQREFSWNRKQIGQLFDSLMRGYTINSFLFWEVENTSALKYRFYHFLRKYRERFHIHNEEAKVDGKSNFTAVLDGQQRLTSLYIALKGSHALKKKTPGLRWVDDERSVPTSRLYLNISETLNPEEEENQGLYDFSFFEDNNTSEVDIYEYKKCKWFRVGAIMNLRNTSDLLDYMNENDISKSERKIISNLHELIFTRQYINFYLEKDQDLDKALNIFIRTNDGGTPLDFSELVMSIVVSNWQERDARQLIHALTDNIASDYYSLKNARNKNFVLRTYLYLYSKDIRFKVTNFNSQAVEDFESDWENISEAIKSSFELVSSFGYDDRRLISKNTMLPIIYYLYHRKIFKGFKDDDDPAVKKDREIIKKWLHTVTLRQVFGGASQSTLIQIRNVFTQDKDFKVKMSDDIKEFPADIINEKTRRAIAVDDNFLEELLSKDKDDHYTFAILSLLYPFLDYKNGDFHIDHMHPRSAFETEDEAGYGYYNYTDRKYHTIPNLQMLSGQENLHKSNKSLKEWFEMQQSDSEKIDLYERYIIPKDASLEFDDFDDFYAKRKELLKARLREALS